MHDTNMFPQMILFFSLAHRFILKAWIYDCAFRLPASVSRVFVIIYGAHSKLSFNRRKAIWSIFYSLEKLFRPPITKPIARFKFQLDLMLRSIMSGWWWIGRDSRFSVRRQNAFVISTVSHKFFIDVQMLSGRLCSKNVASSKL